MTRRSIRRLQKTSGQDGFYLRGTFSCSSRATISTRGSVSVLLCTASDAYPHLGSPSAYIKIEGLGLYIVSLVRLQPDLWADPTDALARKLVSSFPLHVGAVRNWNRSVAILKQSHKSHHYTLHSKVLTLLDLIQVHELSETRQALPRFNYGNFNIAHVVLVPVCQKTNWTSDLCSPLLCGSFPPQVVFHTFMPCCLLKACLVFLASFVIVPRIVPQSH